MNEPPILPGCSVLPSMAIGDDSIRRRLGGTFKAKGAANRRTNGDRFPMLNAFVDFSLAGLRRNELAVWLILYRDTKNGIARTSQMDIARRAGASDRSVRRAIVRLESKGLLKVTYQGGLRRGVSAYWVRPLPPDP